MKEFIVSNQFLLTIRCSPITTAFKTHNCNRIRGRIADKEWDSKGPTMGKLGGKVGRKGVHDFEKDTKEVSENH